jgi:uncharacterized membrane protein
MDLLARASSIRGGVTELIAQAKPDWKQDGYVCLRCLNRLRTQFVRQEMEAERGELTQLEEQVLKKLHSNENVVEDMNAEFDKKLTFGERLADRVASFGGSWTFIMIFFALLATWVTGNSLYWMYHPFDPYPFILLNLVMSLLASIQAPIIMMSQNRAGARDRLQAENDFRVNLRAEIEVRALTEKVDQLLHNQWVRLMEIQQIQMDMLEDLRGR